eukprot:scaffold163221_cov31-Tisochrysis_lutea.AAC.2
MCRAQRRLLVGDLPLPIWYGSVRLARTRHGYAWDLVACCYNLGGGALRQPISKGAMTSVLWARQTDRPRVSRESS